MVAVPAAKPVTKPVLLIVAVVAALLLQVPPVVLLANLEVSPKHVLGVPVMAATVGNANTVSVVVAVPTQPRLLVTV